MWFFDSVCLCCQDNKNVSVKSENLSVKSENFITTILNNKPIKLNCHPLSNVRNIALSKYSLKYLAI